MPDHPVQELVVAIAGPLVTVVIAVGLYAGGVARCGGWVAVANMENPAADLLSTLMRANVALVLFNLIPAFPTDGGRVLRALLATRMNYAQATRFAATVGQVLAFGFAIWGLVTGTFLLVLIAVFVYFGAGQEAAAAQVRELARNVPVTEAMIARFATLSTDHTVASAVEALMQTSQHEFPVVDVAGQVVGILTRDDMTRALRTAGPDVPVSSIMHGGVPAVRAGASFDLEDRPGRPQERGLSAPGDCQPGERARFISSIARRSKTNAGRSRRTSRCRVVKNHGRCPCRRTRPPTRARRRGPRSRRSSVAS
jgi:CBS domain-containing protein